MLKLDVRLGRYATSLIIESFQGGLQGEGGQGSLGKSKLRQSYERQFMYLYIPLCKPFYIPTYLNRPVYKHKK
jgi:hypothetical protein